MTGLVTGTSLEQIPLARPILGPEEEERVLAVLRSGQLSLGPLLGEFERAFAARLGRRLMACAVSSGTAGLHLALRAVGVSDGDEVITSPVLASWPPPTSPCTSGRDRCSPTSTR